MRAKLIIFYETRKKDLAGIISKSFGRQKTFDLRLADWECNKGDILVLREWDPKTGEFTGRIIEKEVTFVGKTKEMAFWTKEDVEKYGYQIMAFK